MKGRSKHLTERKTGSDWGGKITKRGEEMKDRAQERSLLSAGGKCERG